MDIIIVMSKTKFTFPAIFTPLRYSEPRSVSECQARDDIDLLAFIIVEIYHAKQNSQVIMCSVYKTKRPGGIWEKVNLDFFSYNCKPRAEFQNTCWGLYWAKRIPYGPIPPHPLQKQPRWVLMDRELKKKTKNT